MVPLPKIAAVHVTLPAKADIIQMAPDVLLMNAQTTTHDVMDEYFRLVPLAYGIAVQSVRRIRSAVAEVVFHAGRIKS